MFTYFLRQWQGFQSPKPMLAISSDAAPTTRAAQAMTLLPSWRQIHVILLACWLGLLGACTTPQPAPLSAYKPSRGQMGKDVMWLPTSETLVDKMLTMAKLSASDVLFDLGAGDGIIPITAAKKFGAQAVGIEYNPKLAAYAQQQVIEQGVADKVKIIQGDIFEENFSRASVLTLYLLPELNFQLRPTILDMQPGTRVVSHDFDMADWQPDQTVQHGREFAHLWVVPAKVAGVWDFENEGKPIYSVSVSQAFQQVGAVVTLSGVVQTAVGAQLVADQLRFQYVDVQNTLHTVNARIQGAALTAEDASVAGVTAVQAKRR